MQVAWNAPCGILSSVFHVKNIVILLIEINKGGAYKVKNFPANRKKIDIGDYYSNFSYIRSVLGWKPKVTLKEGLIRTLTFYRKNLSHYV